MPQVALDQATISYRVLGPEDSPHPPVVFVHGILVDSRLWDRVADGLASRGFRCYLPDWPLGSHTIPVNKGIELSPRDGRDDDSRLRRRSWGLSDVTLVGNDTGGGLCQLVVDAYPDLGESPGPDQLRCVRQVPAVPLHSRVRAAAWAGVHQGAVRADEVHAAAAFSARFRPAGHAGCRN